MSDVALPRLPDGWTWARLDNICEINPRAWDTPATIDEKVSFIPMAAVEAESGVLDASQERIWGEIEKKSYTKFQEGDILFAKVTPCMENGKIAVASGLHNSKGVGSTEFHVLRPSHSVSGRYLLHYLLQRSFRVAAERSMSGAVGLRRVPTNFLKGNSVPLPPLAEQHRIVETLENHLSRLEAACAALRRSLVRASHLRQSTVRRALRGEGLPLPHGGDAAEEFQPGLRVAPHEQPWRIPDGWLWTTVGSLFNVYVGTTPSRKVPELWSGPIPWVSSGEVSFGRIRSTREHISEEAVGNRKTRLHPPGTVMIAMIGEGKTRGQVAILDIEATHNQNCASIRVSETRILPEYVYLVLEERYQQSRSSSSGGNQPALNKAKVEAIPVPLPPLATQQQIVAQINEFSQTSDRVRAELDKTLKRAAHLRQALFARAFTGQLVPQDSTDEPASVLLDRIQAEREAQGSKGKRGTRRPGKVDATAPPPAPAATPSPTTAVQQELPL